MLMSAADYRESLRRFNPVVFVNGRRIESVADDPVLAPGINAIGTTYDFAFEPEYRPLMLATQASSGREVNRMLHINETSTDLLSKLEAVRLLCKHSGWRNAISHTMRSMRSGRRRTASMPTRAPTITSVSSPTCIRSRMRT